MINDGKNYYPSMLKRVNFNLYNPSRRTLISENIKNPPSYEYVSNMFQMIDFVYT